MHHQEQAAVTRRRGLFHALERSRLNHGRFGRRHAGNRGHAHVMQDHSRHTDRLQRWLAVCALALFAATGRLWTPTAVFPAVPMFALGWPAVIDWLALAGMIGGCLGLLWQPSPRKAGRVAAAVFLVSLLLSFCGDQQRLQPWAWQFALIALVLATPAGTRRLRWWLWLTAAIYLHSGWSKVDASFLATHGQTLLESLAKLLHLKTALWTDGQRQLAVAVLPVGELVIGLAMLLAPRRPMWVWLSIAMHLGLLAMLGPWGLDHSAGVLLWNVYFIGQNLCLYAAFKAERRAVTLAETEPAAQKTAEQSLMTHVAIIVCLLLAAGAPCLAGFGYWDQWPAWSVYASAAPRFEVEIRSDAIDALPAVAQPFVVNATTTDSRTAAEWLADDDTAPVFQWRQLDLHRWSLSTLKAPAYASARYDLALARSLVARGVPAEALRLRQIGRADRRTGQRTVRNVAGTELESLAKRYWWNTQPR